jgi:hypothetical protein
MTGLTPDITAVAVVEHGVLRLTFADGTTGEVSVLERMRGPVFAGARTPTGFARAAVDGLAPDTLYERIRTGTWPDQSLAA